MEVVQIIFSVLFWIAFGYSLYNAFLFIIGMFMRKQKYPIVEDKQKFCVFVPCHNEGEVVGAAVENYSHIEYAKDKFEIFFIADNCADDTAERLREAIARNGTTNFHVLERKDSPSDQRGKPHALRWAINQLEKDDQFYSKFDFLMIFDADNFVDSGILRHVNSQYLHYKPNHRPAMIQTYLDSKNNKGIIAKGYFATYRLMCTLWQTAKQFLHLMPQVGGTGFAIETAFLKEIGGFNCHSLTEDLEISAVCTMKNRFIAFNRNVRIYDEKPTHLKQSLVQRTRWAQGHWYVSFKFIPVLFVQLFNPKTFRNFFRKVDMIIYLLARFFCIITCLNLLFALFWGLHLFAQAIMQSPSIGSLFYLIVHGEYIKTSELIDLSCGQKWVFIVGYVALALSLIAIPIASMIDGTKQEKKRLLKDAIPNILCLYLVSLFDLITTWPGLFKSYNQKVWKKTAHNITSLTRTDKQNNDEAKANT